jgi:phage-related minor tail protein
MADSPLDQSLSGAAQAFADFANGPVAGTTASIEAAVTKSFNSVASTISRAAVSGQDSMAQLTAAILADFDRIGVSQFIVKPVEGVIGSAISSLLPVAGARATGGPVGAGNSYLVGENGPELFTPSGNGDIAPNSALSATRTQVVVNITTPDAQSFTKSKSQVAAMLARAIAQGNRNL